MDTKKQRIHGLPMVNSTKAQTVGIQIPLDAHPDVIRGKSSLLEPARQASRVMWDVWNKVKVATGEVTDKKRLAGVAQKAVERAFQVTETNVKYLKKSRGVLIEQVAATVTPKAPDALGVEIRAHFKSGNKAFFEVGAAIQKGDKRTVAAVLTAPAYLSGLDDKQYNTLLDMAKKQLCPEDSGTIMDIDNAVARLERSAEQMSTTFAPLIREWLGNDEKALEDLQKHGK